MIDRIIITAVVIVVLVLGVSINLISDMRKDREYQALLDICLNAKRIDPLVKCSDYE